MQDTWVRFDHWVGKIPWRKKWEPMPVFLLGKSDRPRSLVGCSPYGHKELDRMDGLSTHIILYSGKLSVEYEKVKFKSKA